MKAVGAEFRYCRLPFTTYLTAIRRFANANHKFQNAWELGSCILACIIKLLNRQQLPNCADYFEHFTSRSLSKVAPLLRFRAQQSLCQFRRETVRLCLVDPAVTTQLFLSPSFCILPGPPSSPPPLPVSRPSDSRRLSALSDARFSSDSDVGSDCIRRATVEVSVSSEPLTMCTTLLSVAVAVAVAQGMLVAGGGSAHASCHVLNATAGGGGGARDMAGR